MIGVVTRYELYLTASHLDMGNDGMRPADDGDFVSYTDYATLEAEIATLKRQLAEFKQEAEEVVRPFAEQANTHNEQMPDVMFIDDYEHPKDKPWRSLAGLRIGDLRRARTFLDALQTKDK